MAHRQQLYRYVSVTILRRLIAAPSAQRRRSREFHFSAAVHAHAADAGARPAHGRGDCSRPLGFPRPRRKRAVCRPRATAASFSAACFQCLHMITLRCLRPRRCRLYLLLPFLMRKRRDFDMGQKMPPTRAPFPSPYDDYHCRLSARSAARRREQQFDETASALAPVFLIAADFAARRAYRHDDFAYI